MDYSTISVKTFIEIGSTHNFELLLPGCKDEVKLDEIWQGIIEENAKANGTGTTSAFLRIFQLLNYLIAEYLGVRAALWKSMFIIDNDTIEFLKSKGYHLKADPLVDTRHTYRDSIVECLNLVENTKTRIIMERKKLLRISNGNSDGPVQSITYEEIIANITDALGFQVPGDLTLALFNEYKKVIKRKNEHLRQRNQQAGYNNR